MNRLLKFGLGNSKLGRHIYTFTLPSGYTCPGARDCMAKANRQTGKVTDGPNQAFRCFAVSSESRFQNVRALAWHNFDLLKECESQADMGDLILASLPREAKIVRVHIGGDFYCERYFKAWMHVARCRPTVRFYAYTKSPNYWKDNESHVPSNFRLTASEGGKFSTAGFKTSKVVFSIEEAAALGLRIDHDDSHAYDGEDSFALLIHGMQPAGSSAGRAVRQLAGVGSYSRNATRVIL